MDKWMDVHAQKWVHEYPDRSEIWVEFELGAEKEGAGRQAFGNSVGLPYLEEPEAYEILLRERAGLRDFTLSPREIANLFTIGKPTQRTIKKLRENLRGSNAVRAQSPRLNIQCDNCSFKLGIRPGEGPRGERPPNMVWVASLGVRRGMQPLLQFVTPDGQIRMLSVRRANDASYEVLKICEEAVTMDAEAVTHEDAESGEELLSRARSYDPWFYRLHELDSMELPTESGWLLILREWQDEIRIDARSNLAVKYRSAKVEVGATTDGTPDGTPTIVPFPVFYRSTDGVFRHKNVMLSLGSQPVYSGTIGRCPRCKHDQVLL